VGHHSFLHVSRRLGLAIDDLRLPVYFKTSKIIHPSLLVSKKDRGPKGGAQGGRPCENESKTIRLSLFYLFNREFCEAWQKQHAISRDFWDPSFF
jgi:hypothetical protein